MKDNIIGQYTMLFYLMRCFEQSDGITAEHLKGYADYLKRQKVLIKGKVLEVDKSMMKFVEEWKR